MKKTFSIISLGCPRNLVDSECIISEFKKKRYAYKEKIDNIDILIINTCAFIEDAKKESIDTILKAIDAKENDTIKRIIVTGCLSQRYKKELQGEFKGVDEFRGVVDFKATFKRDLTDSLTPSHSAYIKISEGCRNRCSYCIIPYIKGPYRSRPMDSIVKESEDLFKKGVREIVLVGQDTSLYGVDLYKKKILGVLLKKLDKISGENWVRVLYSHPANLDRSIIEIIRDSKNICRYIDLPIEHISDRILRQMGRKTKKKDIISLIGYIRSSVPDIALRTSIIVGFPGETERDFQELLSFIKAIKFERLGLFRYSREEGTPAAKFKNQLSEKEKDRRFNEAMSLQQAISSEINENFKDKVLKVLIENREEDYYIARTQYDAPEVDGVVYVKGENLRIGDFYNVRITDTYEYDLVGEYEPCK